MKKFLIIFSWILVVFWMSLIFYLSAMNGNTSTYKSEKTINMALKKTLETTNDMGLTNTNPNSSKISKIAESLDYPLRKIMHFGMYFILTLLLVNALYRSNIKGMKMFYIAFIISFFYACSDEFHQLFTDRTGSFLDVLIDSFGSLTSILLLLIFKKIINRKKEI